MRPRAPNRRNYQRDMAEDSYVTMLLTDDYLMGKQPVSKNRISQGLILSFIGVQVLAASLRDAGTTKKLTVVVPAEEPQRLLRETLTQLEVESPSKLIR